MLRLSELRLSLEHGSNDLQEAVLRRLRIPPDQLLEQRLVKRSIDARRRDRIQVIYSVDVSVRSEAAVLRRHRGNPRIRTAPDTRYRMVAKAPPAFPVSPEQRPVVVGAGPCGYFAALLLAHLQPLAFVEALGTYWLLTLCYNFLLKRIFLLDLFSLASLYTLRLIAGAGAVGVIASPWLLAFSMALFFGLGAVKRVTELVNKGKLETERIDSEQEASFTLPGRAYSSQHRELLILLGTTASAIAVLVFLFLQSSNHLQILFQNYD